MYNGPEEPVQVVSKLRNQTTTLKNVLIGHYRFTGDKVQEQTNHGWGHCSRLVVELLGPLMATFHQDVVVPTLCSHS